MYSYISKYNNAYILNRLLPEIYNISNHILAFRDWEFVARINESKVYVTLQRFRRVLDQLMFDNDGVLLPTDNEYLAVLQSYVLRIIIIRRILCR